MGQQGGFGMVVKVAVGTAGTLTALAHLKDADWPEIKNILADVTAHDSTDGYQEWMAVGKKEVGSFDMELIFDIDETAHAELMTLRGSGAAVGWSIETPAGDVLWAFDGIVVHVTPATPQDDAMTATATVQPTGVVTETYS